MEFLKLSHQILKILKVLDETKDEQLTILKEVAKKMSFLERLSPDDPLAQEYVDRIIFLNNKEAQLASEGKKLEKELAYLEKQREEVTEDE